MPVSVKLDDALRARIQDLAARQRWSATWIMRKAIAQHVEREQTAKASRMRRGRPGSSIVSDKVSYSAVSIGMTGP